MLVRRAITRLFPKQCVFPKAMTVRQKVVCASIGITSSGVLTCGAVYYHKEINEQTDKWIVDPSKKWVFTPMGEVVGPILGKGVEKIINVLPKPDGIPRAPKEKWIKINWKTVEKIISPIVVYCFSIVLMTIGTNGLNEAVKKDKKLFNQTTECCLLIRRGLTIPFRYTICCGFIAIGAFGFVANTYLLGATIIEKIG